MPRASLQRCLLYLCADSRAEGLLDAVLAAGVDVVQLREKGLEAQPEIALCRRFAAAAKRHDRLFSVNDRVDVAYVVRPDILHLGQDDMTPTVAREMLGPDVTLGRSTHRAEEVEAAVADRDVDYFCVGPVWPTPTKPGRPAPGLDLLRFVAALSPAKPWFAIGGIGAENLDDVLATGARRVVVVRAIAGAADPAAATRELAGRLREAAGAA